MNILIAKIYYKTYDTFCNLYWIFVYFLQCKTPTLFRFFSQKVASTMMLIFISTYWNWFSASLSNSDWLNHKRNHPIKDCIFHQLDFLLINHKSVSWLLSEIVSYHCYICIVHFHCHRFLNVDLLSFHFSKV